MASKNRVFLERQGEYRFEVSFDYDTDIIDLIKSFDGRKFDFVKKTWSIPNQFYDEFNKKLALIGRYKVYGIKNKESLKPENVVVEISNKDNKLFVKFPYVQNIVNEVKDLNGVWNPEQANWIIEIKYSEHFEDFLNSKGIKYSHLE